MALESRKDRGLAIAKSAVIVENADGSFSVPSQTVGEIAYRVVPLNGSYLCNCPDYIQRHEEVGLCKHIHAVKFWIAARVELQSQPKPKVFADDAIQCWRCGSIRVIHYGTKRGRQAFKCRDCGRRFIEHSLLRGSKYSPEMVSLTLDLYFSGTSLRKTARILNSHYGTKMGKSSVYRWIQTLVPRVAEYVNSLSPQTSDTWNADELFVKMRKGVKDTQYKQENMAFLWNVMDRKTRFLLASKLSRFRDVQGSRAAFDEAFHNAGSLPERVMTDGLKAYNMAFNGVHYDLRPELVARMGVSKPHANNNRIERLNGTLRERVKIQRGWKSMKTPLAEGIRIQYNFVKPHAALEGQTPAQRAGVGVEGKDKWLSLLRSALTLPRGTGA